MVGLPPSGRPRYNPVLRRSIQGQMLKLQHRLSAPHGHRQSYSLEIVWTRVPVPLNEGSLGPVQHDEDSAREHGDNR